MLRQNSTVAATQIKSTLPSVTLIPFIHLEIHMPVESWLVYLALVIAATATPGPAVLFIISSSTLYGWKRAIYAALGNITGLFCMGIIAVAGLGAILSTSVTCFNVVKYCGALYLFYLGIKLIFQKKYSTTLPTKKNNNREISAYSLFFKAFFVAVSNPKAIVFLTALLPQFIRTEEAIFPQFLLLIFTLMFFSFLALMCYALLIQKCKDLLNTTTRLKNFNRVSGAVFIGFGLLLATSSNK